MIDTLWTCPDFSKKKKQGLIEVGCGSGAIILTLASPPSMNIAIDRNFLAAVQTNENAKVNNIPLLSVVGHLLTPFRKGALPKTVLFNPPYLPADPELDRGLTEWDRMALIGGKRGDETAWELVKGLEKMQEAYIIFSTIATDGETIMKKAKQLKIEAEIVKTLSLGLETLLLIRFKNQKV